MQIDTYILPEAFFDQLAHCKRSPRLNSTHYDSLSLFSVWWGMKYAPGGHSSFFGFINSFVHIPMYLYYGLSAIGPHMNKYLFWKKYMTSLQMVSVLLVSAGLFTNLSSPIFFISILIQIQFVAIFVHSFQLLFRDCDYPQGFVYWIGSHAILFWFLFWDFFKATYLRSEKSKAKDKLRNSTGASNSSRQATSSKEKGQ